jgi:DNA helicase II / ATP-dependent DNA helicase PcrA
MTTERFSKKEFEDAISELLDNNWDCAGLIAGEYRYRYAVLHHSTVILMWINSSVGADGFAFDTGANSIRVWLTSEDNKPVSKKVQDYVTRVAGWKVRLHKVIAETIQQAHDIATAMENKSKTIETPKSPKCPRCGSPMVVRSRRSDGHKFWGCTKYPVCNGSMDIEPEPIQLELIKKTEPVISASAPVFVPSKYQTAIYNWLTNAVKNRKLDQTQALLVEALAGSGKTTTGVKMLKMIPSNLEVIFVAFGKDIATELQKRAPANVVASTLHSVGYVTYSAWARQNGVEFSRESVVDDKASKLLETILSKQMFGHLYGIIIQLLSLTKANLLYPDDKELAIKMLDIAEHYGLELNGDGETIIATAIEVLKKTVEKTATIDFDDMCYLPIVKNMAFKRYDVVFVDEAQDLNKNQNEMVARLLKPGGILIAVGDRFQSMYGFRGAELDSIDQIITRFHADTLPLSITYRCPKSVVQLCNDKFPMIPLEPKSDAIEGSIVNMHIDKADMEWMPGDMVLCRVNAPLAKYAYKTIGRGVKAVIKGRDFGKGLLALLKKFRKLDSLLMVLDAIREYRDLEVTKLAAMNKNGQAQTIEDKCETIFVLSDGCKTVDDLEHKINTIFSDKDVDSNNAVVFSSVHRAKGLEADNIWILQPEKMPHPMAKKSWEKEQELHIEYVAYTRAKVTLTFVKGAE